MQSYPIPVEDVIIILSKETLLSPESSFYADLSLKNDVIKIAPAYCGGVLCSKDGKIVLKLLQSSPKNLYKQLKKGNLFLK
ncbi:MAG: hypothetical protein PHE12_00200 [Clostridia bacterium]|nr:hypothetical protein [Clostridia bacterium]